MNPKGKIRVISLKLQFQWQEGFSVFIYHSAASLITEQYIIDKARHFKKNNFEGCTFTTKKIIYAYKPNLLYSLQCIHICLKI